MPAIRRSTMARSSAPRAATTLLGASAAAWLTWAFVRASGDDSTGLEALAVLSSPYAVAPLALLAGVLLGARLSAARTGPLVPIALSLVLYLGVVWTLEPGKLPLGYANANAAMGIQVLALSAIAAATCPTRGRPALLASAGAAVAVVLANSSVAAVPLAAGVVALILVAAASGARRWPVRVLALGALVGTAGCWYGFWWLVREPAADTWLAQRGDPTRGRLWADALEIWDSNPRRGAGPGAFATSSPLAADPDTSAAHSLLLQVGAEVGWIGLGLLATIWLAGLILATRGTARTAIPALAAWSALAVHSLVDHLVDFAPVMLTAGMVLGWAGASGERSEQLDVTQTEAPLRRFGRGARQGPSR